MSNYQMSIRSIWRKMVNWGFNKKTLKWAALFVVLKWTLIPILVAYLVSIYKWHWLYWFIFPLFAVAYVLYQKHKRVKR